MDELISPAAYRAEAEAALTAAPAERYTAQNATPSKFLGAIADVVSAARHQGSGATFAHPVPLMPQAPRDFYPGRELTRIRNGTCLKCDTCGATSGCS